MANLIYYYGTMESGKTTKLIQDYYNYTKNNIPVLLVKPSIDTKGGDKIVSRMKEEVTVDMLITPDYSFLDNLNLDYLKFILVDEAQFLEPWQVDELWEIAHTSNITVIAYGLKSNYMGVLFRGSSELFARADELRELIAICKCGNIAKFNPRKINGVYDYNNEEEFVIDNSANVEYTPLCSECFYDEVISKYKNKALVRKKEK